ncbi:MAG: hypothetical protein R3F39_00230 [Myxococcota bacterium]
MSEKRRGGGGLVVVGLALAVTAGWFARNFLPGLGADLGLVDRPAVVADTEPGYLILVRSEQCVVGNGEPTPCDVACKAEAITPTTQVDVDATEGAHATVEALRACLTARGITKVNIRSR